MTTTTESKTAVYTFRVLVPTKNDPFSHMTLGCVPRDKLEAAIAFIEKQLVPKMPFAVRVGEMDRKFGASYNMHGHQLEIVDTDVEAVLVSFFQAFCCRDPYLPADMETPKMQKFHVTMKFSALSDRLLTTIDEINKTLVELAKLPKRLADEGKKVAPKLNDLALALTGLQSEVFEFETGAVVIARTVDAKVLGPNDPVFSRTVTDKAVV